MHNPPHLIAAAGKAILLLDACRQNYFSSVDVIGPCRLELGPQFEPVQVEPALECLDFDADTHELWLLQLPLDVWSLRHLQDSLLPCNNSYLSDSLLLEKAPPRY